MPRVSAEHLERRRQQILDAARACFVRKGVHDTSMQDIFAESGLSAGAVYRYFKSKSEIVEAIMSMVLTDMRGFITDLTSADPPLPLDEVIERVTRMVVLLSGEDGPVHMAPHAWSLAMHDPALRSYIKENMTTLRESWIGYVERLVAAGMLPAGTDPVATSKVIFAMMPGFLIQRLFLGDVTPEEFRVGVRTLVRQSLTASADVASAP
ncbi:TetR/AcrR family transcriptional regulator [Actinomadura kijaniata]|uniref:TetR/AcrR family transcriptional regulator n=1 Tax=Actinomadura kijaniata TaxID=46161 RepID=UPI00082CC137|nr:TetR/AcrR family transcriptional regulator [Actinomadura kijaniata]